MNDCASETELVALATGEGTAATRTHLRRCAGCASRYDALAADLLLLRRTLLDEPLPAIAWRAHRRWWPVAAAAGAIALLALAWIAPWRQSPGVRSTQRVAHVSGLARDVSVALFAPPQTVGVAPISDSVYLEAALNGGWPCGGSTLYGMDCQPLDPLELADR